MYVYALSEAWGIEFLNRMKCAKKIERVQWGNTIKTESMVLSMERMGKCW